MKNTSVRDTMLARVANLDSLPTLPVVLERLNQEVASPTSSAADIARIIEDDQAIMARVMRLVNSPLFAPTFRKHSGVSLHEAVVRLGLNELRNIVMTTSMMTLFPTREDASFDRIEFWRHSICVGLVARVLKEFSTVEVGFDETEFGMAGLCHDIGKVILDQYFNDVFQDALSTAKFEGRLLFEAEHVTYGTDHGEIGQVLAERWRLPESLGMVMRYHHAPHKIARSEHELLARVVQLADFICNHQGLGFSGNGRAMEFPRASFEALGLDVASIPDILERVHQQADNSEILLTIGMTERV